MLFFAIIEIIIRVSVIVIGIIVLVMGRIETSSDPVEAFRRSCLMLGRAPRDSSGLGNQQPLHYTSLLHWFFGTSKHIQIYEIASRPMDFHRLL